MTRYVMVNATKGEPIGQFETKEQPGDIVNTWALAEAPAGSIVDVSMQSDEVYVVVWAVQVFISPEDRIQQVIDAHRKDIEHGFVP